MTALSSTGLARERERTFNVSQSAALLILCVAHWMPVSLAL
jgi:hypothetical protein